MMDGIFLEIEERVGMLNLDGLSSVTLGEENNDSSKC